jgi:hypothetical protein
VRKIEGQDEWGTSGQIFLFGVYARTRGGLYGNAAPICPITATAGLGSLTSLRKFVAAQPKAYDD